VLAGAPGNAATWITPMIGLGLEKRVVGIVIKFDAARQFLNTIDSNMACAIAKSDS
jgi:hypothetical protein